MLALIILVHLSLPVPVLTLRHDTSPGELDSSNPICPDTFTDSLCQVILHIFIRCSCPEIVPCRSLVRQRPRSEKTVKGSRCPICALAQPPHHCITRSLSTEPHCRSIHMGKSLLAYSLTATSTRTDKADSTAALSSSYAVERRKSVSSCPSAYCERAVIALPVRLVLRLSCPAFSFTLGCCARLCKHSLFAWRLMQDLSLT